MRPGFHAFLLGFAILGLLVAALACQPRDERAGLWLTGEATAQPVDDWSFTDGIEEIFIETRPWYGLPHSTTIWCVELDGRLYVGSYGAEKKAWEQAIAHDPEARLRIDGRLYDVSLAPVTEPALVRRLTARYNEKYDMQEVFGEEVPEWWYYRVESSRGAIGYGWTQSLRNGEETMNFLTLTGTPFALEVLAATGR